jgi:hypothetical protein
LEGFSQEQFEHEFKGFWESQGGALTQTYWQELEKGLDKQVRDKEVMLTCSFD